MNGSIHPVTAPRSWRARAAARAAFIALCACSIRSVAQVTPTDGDWTAQYVALTNTPEAALMVRAGDVDNLGSRWPAGFDPFSGDATPSHNYPWTPRPGDADGTDRIMVVTSYAGNPPSRSTDDYTAYTRRPDNAVRAITLNYPPPAFGVTNATLQMFLDDFQPSLFLANYQVTINGRRAPFLESMVNQLLQTGPVGWLASVAVPAEFLPDVASGRLELKFDDLITGAGDGYAVDFVKVLINPLQPQAAPDSFNPNPDGPVYALAVQSDGKVLAGGDFWVIGGQTRRALARLNADGTLDASLNANLVVNSYFGPRGVHTMIVQTDGGVIVGGNFSSASDQPRLNLARLHSDGSLDASFTAQTDGPVHWLAAQADGKILVAGNFTQLAGQPCRLLGRLNADGTLDARFNVGGFSTWPQPVVYVALPQAGGKILIGGCFTSIDGVARTNLARLNADGTLDNSFKPAVTGGPDACVLVFAEQPDGKILVSGNFTNVAGAARNNLARLNSDGSLDAGFVANASNWVGPIALQADGKIVVGGGFTNIAGQVRNKIARLNADGTLDATFTHSVGTAYNVSSYLPIGVNSLALQSDGKILAGGYLRSLDGQPRRHLGRLDNTASASQELGSDGATLTWLRGGSGPEVQRSFATASTNGADWISLGDGTRAAGGWRWNAAAIPTNATYRALGFVAGGDSSTWFVESSIGPVVITRQPTSRTNNATSTATFTVSAAGSGLFGYQWRKDGLDLSDGGKISGARTDTLTLTNVFGAEAGGYSVMVSGVSGSVTSVVARLVVMDPLVVAQPLSLSRNAGQSASFSVSAIGTAPLSYQWRKNGVPLSGQTAASLTLTNLIGAHAGNYDVIVTNTFSGTASTAASLTVNLSTPDGFNPNPPGLSYSVTALAVQPDGKVLAGETAYQFQDFGWQSVYSVRRFNEDGSRDASFKAPEGYGFDDHGGQINAIAVDPDGKIIVATEYWDSFSDVYESHEIYRLNSDGSVDGTFQPSQEPGQVNALALEPDGKILVGGWFNRLAGQAHANLGRLNPDGTPDGGFNPDVVGWISCLTVQPDGDILAGGNISAINGQSRSHLARLHPDGSLDSAFAPVVGTACSDCSGAVWALALQPDGRILIGGIFTNVSGLVRSNLARLEASGALDNTFNPGAGRLVFSLALQADGGIVVGGDLISLGGQPRNGLGRLRMDGTLDLTFNPGTGYVRRLAVQPDGRILAGGDFWSLGGSNRASLGRLNTSNPVSQSLVRNGSTLQWLRTEASPEVGRATFEVSTNRVDWQSLGTGARVPGGWQVNVGATPTNATFVAHGYVSASGDPWFVQSSFGPLALVMQPTSRTNLAASVATFAVVAVGSSPLNYQWQKDGVNMTNGGKISGANSATLVLTNVLRPDSGGYSVVVSNASGSITSLVATLTVIDPAITSQPAGLTREPGQTAQFFSAATGTPPLRYQWQKDGSPLPGATATSFTLTNVSGADTGDYELVVSNVFGTATSSVARLTVLDPFIVSPPVTQTAQIGHTATFSVSVIGTAPFSYQWRKAGAALAGATGSSLTLTNVQAGDSGAYDVVVGNRFSSAISEVAILTVNLAAADDFNPGADGSVLCLAPQPDGKILVGGAFSTLAGAARSNLGRLNADGSLDPTFDPTVHGEWWSVVTALAVQPDGKVIVAGYFSSVAGEARNNLARLNPDGTLDESFNPGADYQVSSLDLQPDGKILVCGYFATLAGQPRWSLGRLNADGTLDAAFNPQVEGNVQTLVLQPDGRIVVGGYFFSLDGAPHVNLGRLNADGTVDDTFNSGADVSWDDGVPAVYCLGLQADGRILVGGHFATLGSAERNSLGRLNPDGSVDETFSPQPDFGSWFLPQIASFAQQADGQILVGGSFVALDGVPRNYFARLDRDGKIDPRFDPAMNGIPYALTVQTNGTILLGGYFFTVGEQPRTNIARLNPTDPATDELTFDGSTVTWRHGGSAPDIARASFEASANGVDWVNLGQGAYVANGWQLTNAFLSGHASLRARGFVTGGFCSGSTWFVESAIRVNLPPVADASATVAHVISSNGTNAVVRLDGSRSRDPEGDVLQYAWFEVGNPTPLASSAVAVVTLPIGTRALQLVVSDEELPATNTITVEVITAYEAATRLLVDVNARAPRPQRLTAMLSAALAALQRGDFIAVAHLLQAFQNQVRAQVAPSNATLAASLIRSAQDIVDALCSDMTNQAPPQRGLIIALHRDSNGHTRIQFLAEPRRLHLVETSPDLRSWETLGAAAERPDGAFEFEDADAPSHAARFYRIATP